MTEEDPIFLAASDKIKESVLSPNRVTMAHYLRVRTVLECVRNPKILASFAVLELFTGTLYC
jgi:hypothetical protein